MNSWIVNDNSVTRLQDLNEEVRNFRLANSNHPSWGYRFVDQFENDWAVFYMDNGIQKIERAFMTEEAALQELDRLDNEIDREIRADLGGCVANLPDWVTSVVLGEMVVKRFTCERSVRVSINDGKLFVVVKWLAQRASDRTFDRYAIANSLLPKIAEAWVLEEENDRDAWAKTLLVTVEAREREVEERENALRLAEQKLENSRRSLLRQKDDFLLEKARLGLA